MYIIMETFILEYGDRILSLKEPISSKTEIVSKVL